MYTIRNDFYGESIKNFDWKTQNSAADLFHFVAADMRTDE